MQGRVRANRRNRRGIAIAVVMQLAATSPVIAEQLPSKIYNTEAGLAHNRVKRIVQDSHGFLWFCTADGLSRFDGHQFTSYRVEDGFPAPSINDLLEASDGVYWVATNSIGIVRFDLTGTSSTNADQRSRFRVYPMSAEPVTNRVNVIYRDRSGMLWAGTDGGLFQLDMAASGFRPVALGIPSRPDIQVQVWALVQDAAGNLWLGTRFGIVVRYTDGRMLHFTVHPVADDDRVSSLLFDLSGRLWIGHRSGLFTYVPDATLSVEDGGRASRAIPTGARRYTTLDGLNHDDVIALHQSDGSIWVRTFGSGLSRFDGSSFRTYLFAPGAGDDVTSITADRDGNLWIGTNTAGALKIATRPWTTYGLMDGLGQVVSSVFENRVGELYVTSSAWRVSRFDGTSFRTVRLPVPPTLSEQSWRGASNILLDHNGEWWVGTREGLYRFGPVDRFETLARARPKAVYTERDGLASDDVTRMFEDRIGDVWIMSWNPARDVLVRWERATATFHRYGEHDGLRPFTSGQTFATDRSGGVWIGFREGGLARYRNGRFTMLGTSDGLPEGGVNSIFVDEAGLWVATVAGLCRIDQPDAERPQVFTYTTADGLTTNLVRRVTGDTAGRIYAASQRGIDRLEPSTGRIRHYSTADGLAGGEFTAALRDRSGTLWFGTSTGLSRLVPEREDSIAAPPILINSVRIAGVAQPLPPLGQTSVSHLELSPGQNNVQIEFFGIGFRTGETLRYRYKLDGASGDWSAPSAERSVTFANLAPGAYAFAVRAIATDGTESGPPATVSFTILPPVWRRSWFVGLIALTSVGATIIVARSRHARIRALRESENRFRTLAETASDAIITIDEDSRIVLVNEATRKIFGYTREELVGKDLTMLMPAHLRDQHHAGLARYKQTANRQMSWAAVELPGLHKDGHEVPLEVSFGEFVRNNRRFFTGIARDVTERRRAQEALQRSREERLAELERVRKRIATDLHDDVGSSLTRISLLSEVVRHQIGGLSPSLAEPLSSIAALARELVDSMSDIVWAINPGKDRLRDLSQRMRQFVSDVCTARQIDLQFAAPSADQDVTVGANLRREVFLVFKEAITNMARHSGCSEAILEFRTDARGLLLQVADNGRGFDVSRPYAGHGLRSMRERIEALGGRFDAVSTPGRGTTLTFTIPFGDSKDRPEEQAVYPHEYAVTHLPESP
jgi:PAS domain S-box-containing protein